MEITVRVEVQYNAPEHALMRDMLRMFRTPVWVRFMVRYISPHLKNCAPAHKDVFDSLNKWRVTCPSSPTTSSLCPSSCVICMTDMADAIELPCGHSFHQDCIESWLKMRSTCPTCRHQLPKAFAGCYAVRSLNSALLLKDEHRQMSKDDILNSRVGKEPVRVIVNVTLGQVAQESKKQQFPCVLNALMAYANGEEFSESETDEVDPVAVETAAGCEAASESTTPKEDVVSHTGRRRRYEETSYPSNSAQSKRARVN